VKSLSAPLLALALAAAPAAALDAQGPLARHSLSVAGVERHYLLYAPPAAGGPVPLVIVLHGGGGNGENAARMTGFTALAQKQGFAVAYPDGTGRFGNVLLTWNAGHCCGPAMRSEVDDVGFIRVLIDTLVKDATVDPARVYVTGMSNGAMLTERLGIELSSRIAAIAPVVGGLFGDEPAPAGPVSALIVNGGEDKSVPPAGGPSGGRFARAWDGTPLRPSGYQGVFWAKANACAAEPTRTQTGAVVEWTYACPEGRNVTRVLVTDQGHAWPGGEKGSRRGDEPSRSYDATAEIWTFFETRHREESREWYRAADAGRTRASPGLGGTVTGIRNAT
jgi:polyhydroxybutyrate depolymerase